MSQGWCQMSYQGEARTLAPNHPLQRVIGGQTSRFERKECIRNEGMSQGWRDEPQMMPSFISRLSVKSGPQSPSAEGDWGPDLTLRLKVMSTFLNDDQMTEWWQNERHLRIQFFCPLPKSPSFLLIPSFGCHSRMPRNENEERRDVIHKTSHSFSLHSNQIRHSRMSRNDGMRVKWGRFLS